MGERRGVSQRALWRGPRRGDGDAAGGREERGPRTTQAASSSAPSPARLLLENFLKLTPWAWGGGGGGGNAMGREGGFCFKSIYEK